MSIEFIKYQALGNDYLVIDRSAIDSTLIQGICDRHYGAGSDGVLLGPLSVEREDLPGSGDAAPIFGLRIFNPDGSEAEKSGNGLRIFARALWDRGDLPVHAETPDQSEWFHIQVPAGIVRAQVLDGGRQVTVEMGVPRFDSPLPGAESLEFPGCEYLTVDGETRVVCVVNMGNPHCVVMCEEISEALARRLGPHIEVHPRFPNRTNVQFLQVIDRENIRIHIWERGADYTLASGSSSCAAAAAAHRLGLCGSRIAVHNPGGDILIEIDPTGPITMTGPVERVYSGAWEADLAAEK